ncbi:tetratricopeptide repeat protein [Candidatus Synchoanobacter obligatus]|uniref:Tetratricopeptide repeat protein n=1 Tax=Candidatus Synchoanobacter obligatus TaxID=2919597 RepID=A0ABT1L3T8_9GAMM|nr:tetratricopeptide repeat protein [Candidatus Synchoanobacter obligatus]MCP8351860.1 tetratricopeptide repeat protein [Candidatus Synchoanobacter obligatus]
MQVDQTAELYYQSLLKRYGKSILSVAAAIVLFGCIWELKAGYDDRQQKAVQADFEQYLAQADTAIVLRQQEQNPQLIQTQLMSLLEAKRSFDQENYSTTEEHLTYVINHATQPAMMTIAAQRLSSLYRHLGDPSKATQVLKTQPHESAYSKFLEAMAADKHSVERMNLLNEALALAPSPYTKQLISVAHYNNIETS